MNSIHIAVNMFKRTFGNRKGLVFMVLIPVLVISGIIAIFDHEYTTTVGIGVVNLDEGNLGERAVRGVDEKEAFEVYRMDSAEVLQDAVVDREKPAAFVIPKDYTAKLMSGTTPTVEVYYLTQNENTVTLKLALEQQVKRFAGAVSVLKQSGASGDELAAKLATLLDQQEKGQVKAVKTDLELYGNPILYLVIGFMLMFMMFSISSAVEAVVEDRKNLTMARIYTAPVKAYQIALGNFIGSTMLGTSQILLMLILTKYVVGFEYGVSFWSMFVVLEAFMLASMGIASTVAGLVKNSNNLSAINNLVITPTCMIGGCWWPISIMPSMMRHLSNFVPQKWAIDAVEKMATGDTLGEVGLHIAILVLFALVLLAFGSVVLRPADDAEA